STRLWRARVTSLSLLSSARPSTSRWKRRLNARLDKTAASPATPSSQKPGLASPRMPKTATAITLTGRSPSAGTGTRTKKASFTYRHIGVELCSASLRLLCVFLGGLSAARLHPLPAREQVRHHVGLRRLADLLQVHLDAIRRVGHERTVRELHRHL